MTETTLTGGNIMSQLVIQGSKGLRGEARVQGSKNSVLPILAASVLCGGESVIHNCPDLSDVRATIDILRYLGCRVEFEGGTLVCDSSGLSGSYIPDKLMQRLRSSIIFLGALIARTGSAGLCFPGGCEIGLRPIDLHIRALESLGVHVEDDHGTFRCTAPDGLIGSRIALSFPSVGATENILICACLAEGTTVITNAAREPEICDLADFLNSSGADIRGAGDSTITIEGVKSLHAAVHTVIPDRIAAATLLSCCAASGGTVTLKDVIPQHLGAVISVLEECGCTSDISRGTITLDAPHRVTSPKIVRTMPYPGFPTDAQAPLMSLSAMGRGTTLFIENIFENRYLHVSGLLRMGANIKVEGRAAVVQGTQLHGADVAARDLRGAAALITAAIGAEGQTRMSGLKYLDRGYESLENTLQSLGADVKRI